MAEVADLFLLHLEEEEDDDDDDDEHETSSPFEIDFEEDDETLDPTTPFWSSVFEEEALIPPPPPIFYPDSDPHPHPHAGSETLDLFHRYPPPETLDTSDFRALDGIHNLPSDYLNLGLGLGLGFDIEDDDDDDQLDHPMVHGSGLRVVGFGSDSESEPDPNHHDQDPNLPLCWDSLRLEEDHRDAVDDDFEWEEVDGRLDERDILSMMVGEGSRNLQEHEEEDGEELQNVPWEVLLAVNNPLADDEGDFVNPSEYEILFGQFAEAVRGCPPASKSVVERLSSVVLTEEDVVKNNTLCAVCKDEISLEEKVKRLPCLHHYHGECILPWLGMRNTCPVCRFELPTDDVEYESWKAQRRGSGGGGGGGGGRYDLDMLSAM